MHLSLSLGKSLKVKLKPGSVERVGIIMAALHTHTLYLQQFSMTLHCLLLLLFQSQITSVQSCSHVWLHLIKLFLRCYHQRIIYTFRYCAADIMISTFLIETLLQWTPHYLALNNIARLFWFVPRHYKMQSTRYYSRTPVNTASPFIQSLLAWLN